MDLTRLVTSDTRLHWTGLFKQLRDVGLIYGGKVVALPVQSYSYVLYYRLDLFERFNLTVPTTWRQMLDLVIRMNGTGVDIHFHQASLFLCLTPLLEISSSACISHIVSCMALVMHDCA